LKEPKREFVPEFKLWLRSSAESILLLKNEVAFKTTVDPELLLRTSSTFSAATAESANLDVRKGLGLGVSSRTSYMSGVPGKTYKFRKVC
jgi:hypothetical protein